MLNSLVASTLLVAVRAVLPALCAGFAVHKSAALLLRCAILHWLSANRCAITACRLATWLRSARQITCKAWKTDSRGLYVQFVHFNVACLTTAVYMRLLQAHT